MSDVLTATIAAALILTALLIVGLVSTRRRARRLSMKRPSMSEAELINALAASGADSDVAVSVARWIAGYYPAGTSPNTGDCMDADVAIDPEDMEDFVAEFFRQNALPEPTLQKPEMLPNYRDVTLTGFANYLTQRRRELLNREVLPA